MKTDLREWLWESCNIEPDVDVEKDSDMVDRSLEAFEYLRTFDSLSHDRIKEAHRILMEGSQPGIAGEYRDVELIRPRGTPSPEFVRAQMDTLLSWEPEDPLEAIRWHIGFEHTHPFSDGNGRVGRILYLVILDKIGAEPIWFDSQRKDGYYSLFDTDRELWRRERL